MGDDLKLHSSSSNESGNSIVPTAFVGNAGKYIPRNSRRSSLSSAFSTRNRSDINENFENYSAKNIYKDLNDEDILLQRTKSRATIINTLEERAAKEQIAKDEEESGSLHREKSYYESAPREEALPTENDGVEFQDIDPELVTWENDDDVQNPRNWSSARKWRSTLVVSVYTLLSPFASTMLAPAMPAINEEFGVSNSAISALAVSIYILAWAIFPPFIAPISEMYGRKIVLDISVWVLLFFNLGCALSQSMPQLIVLRLFAGIGGCAPICIGAGVLGDLFNNNDIALAMSLYSLGPSMGPCFSALISGYVVENSG